MRGAKKVLEMASQLPRRGTPQIFLEVVYNQEEDIVFGVLRDKEESSEEWYNKNWITVGRYGHRFGAHKLKSDIAKVQKRNNF